MPLLPQEIYIDSTSLSSWTFWVESTLSALATVNHGVHELDSSGVWIVPSGVKFVELEFYGGSGGDAGTCWCSWANSSRHGSNGSNGGGGRILLAVEKGDTISYVMGQHGLDDAGPYNGPGQYSSYSSNGNSGLDGEVSSVSLNGTQIASGKKGLGGIAATCTPSPGPGQCFNGNPTSVVNGFQSVNIAGGGIVLSETNKAENKLVIRH